MADRHHSSPSALKAGPEKVPKSFQAPTKPQEAEQAWGSWDPRHRDRGGKGDGPPSKFGLTGREPARQRGPRRQQLCWHIFGSHRKTAKKPICFPKIKSNFLKHKQKPWVSRIGRLKSVEWGAFSWVIEDACWDTVATVKEKGAWGHRKMERGSSVTQVSSLEQGHFHRSEWRSTHSL